MLWRGFFLNSKTKSRVEKAMDRFFWKSKMHMIGRMSSEYDWNWEVVVDLCNGGNGELRQLNV